MGDDACGPMPGAQIWSVVQQILATGTDVVLEFGLLRKEDRDAIRAKVEDAGSVASFHFIDAHMAVRWQRVLRRNVERDETNSFDVTPKMFEAMEAHFERPSDGELARSKIVRGPR